MAETAPYSRIIVKTVENTDYISIPFGKPEYFGDAKKFNFRIAWGDGKITNVKNTYNHKDVSWDRNYDDSGRAQNSAPESDTAVTITHKYEAAGQYDIEIRGGFDNSMESGTTNELDNNDDQMTLKLCFAKSSDRMACRGTPEVIEEINGIGSAQRGEIYVHGQGDFEDFINLKEINCGIRLLTSANPLSNLVHDGGSGKVAFVNTFKNCEKIGVGKKNRIRTLLQTNSPKVVNMEGCFDNCGYNGFLPWNTSLVTNWKRTFRKCKNHSKFSFSFAAAQNLDYALEDSYVGRTYRLPVTVNKNGTGVTDAKWKFVLAKQSDNTAIWSHDGSTLPGEAGGKQPSGSIDGKTDDSGNFTVNLGDLNLMECIDPDSYLDQETDADFINLRLHIWCSVDEGSSFTKLANKNINLNSLGVLKLESDFLFGDLRNVTSMVGTFKDHKKFDANLLRRCFASDVVYKIEDMEACFEGVDFLSIRNVSSESRFKLRLTYAKPTSIKSYIRNSKNAFDIRYIDGSRITNIAHFIQDTDYNQTIAFDMQKVTDASYAFAGCTGNPYIRPLWLYRSGDGKSFANINCEGMFEGSSGWDTDLPWRHLKPTSTERMFNNCESDFKSSLGFGNFDSCTTIRAMFRNSGIKSIGNMATMNLKNVVDASYAFKGTENDINVSKWFNNAELTYKIENIDGMFESSVNTTATSSWATVLGKTVTSARAVFKYNQSVPLDNIIKTFRNTGKNNKVKQIDEFFRGIVLKEGELNDDQRRFLKQWHIDNVCGEQFNVLKGVGYGGPVTYSLCRFKNFETDDEVVVEPEYETVNPYQKSEVTYDHICEDQLIDEVSIPEGLDTVFMAIY